MRDALFLVAVGTIGVSGSLATDKSNFNGVTSCVLLREDFFSVVLTIGVALDSNKVTVVDLLVRFFGGFVSFVAESLMFVGSIVLLVRRAPVPVDSATGVAITPRESLTLGVTLFFLVERAPVAVLATGVLSNKESTRLLLRVDLDMIVYINFKKIVINTNYNTNYEKQSNCFKFR